MIEEWVGGMYDYRAILVSTGLKELVGGGTVKGGRWTIEVKVVWGGRVDCKRRGSKRWEGE